MQCAGAVLSSMVCLAVQYFSTLSHKRYDFRENVTEYKMCFDFICNFCLNISHSKKNSTRYQRKST